MIRQCRFFRRKRRGLNRRRIFPRLGKGLAAAGFNEEEINGILGENWLRFFSHAFCPAK